MPVIRSFYERLRSLLFRWRALGLSSFFLVFTSSSPAADIGRPFDIQGYVDNALRSGAKEVIIPPGRYLVTPNHGVHLALHDLHDLHIVADGVEMVCAQTTMAVSLENCRNVTLRGLTIDYDPLPFTEGTITAVAPDHSWLEFRVGDGYPEQKLTLRVQICDQTTHLLKTADFGWSPIQ